MAVPKETTYINTTGKASVATVLNNMVQTEKPVNMPIGTQVVAIGNLKNFAGVLYFTDVSGKTYNIKDFSAVGNEVVLSVPKEKEPSKPNYFWWFLGGFVVWQAFKK